MSPDEEEPKQEGEPTPEDARAEESAAPEPEPEIAEPAHEEPQPELAEPPLEPEPVQAHEAPAPEPEPEPVKAYDPPEPEYVEPEPPAPVYVPPPPPPVAEPAPSVHEAAARELHEEPLAEIERNYEPPPQAAHEPEPQSVFEQEEYPFGEPDIPMPPPAPRASDRQRRRDAKRNLDLDLGRIKRRKRYGLFITSISVLFIAFVLAPVTWVTVYLFVEPPSTVLMMQRAAEGETIRHYPVPLNRISPHAVRALIASEDANFCTHDGFDIEAIQRAMESNRRGNGPMRGGSTISQQTAKNLFLWPERGWVRKGFETYFTALIEFMWPKRRVMEAYLNNIEFGDGNFGIEAAARARFGVSAADLTPLQAARLAAIVPSPNRWSATNPGPYVRGRSATIVARAREVRNSGTASCVLAMDRPENR